jgi:hypothetical protein
LGKEENARFLVMIAIPEQLQVVRGEVMKVMEVLKGAEKDFDMQKYLLDRMKLKLQTAEK